MENTITTNSCWLIPVDASAIVAFIALIFSGFTFYYQRKHSERSVQPVIIFFIAEETNMWAFKNVGKEPAINMALSYKPHEPNVSNDWVSNENWPIGFPSIKNEDKPTIPLDIDGAHSIRAEYEDINGNMLSTTICGNQNKIERDDCWWKLNNQKKKFKQLAPVRVYEWQLYLRKTGIPNGYKGISTKPDIITTQSDNYHT